MKTIIIAIDGPAAAGKSTVAKMVAKRINYIYIDSGAMYRALTLKAIRSKIDVFAEAELMKLLAATKIEPKGNKILLDGEDVSHAIRGKKVTENVSTVSSHGGVREELVKIQKQLGSKGGIVMDGRDIGTCVFPKAELKIFQVASVEQRALRRYEENLQKGIECDVKSIKEEIKIRDFKDTTRKISPLKMARDAIALDTSFLTPEESCEKILQLFYKIVGEEVK